MDFLCSGFSDKTISALISHFLEEDIVDVFEKKQIQYIYNYLQDLNCQYILLEPEFFDDLYLEDYQNSAIKYLDNKNICCARLHFFSKQDDDFEISHQTISDYLKQKTDEYEQNL
ncbi:MAG: hypothetical protein ISP86_04965, partial [Shewanellaceae bacterium]|nr:hypothetical protein [Shewanellaceae bacterium]